MLEGLEISVVKLSELESEIRIDAEVYNKTYVKGLHLIKSKKFTTFEKESKIIKKGIFNINSSHYTSKGIPFIRISNLKNMMLDENEMVFISEFDNDVNKKTELRYGDIILSKTAIPAASIVSVPVCNSSQDTVVIKLKDNSCLDSFFVVVFLNSKYGLEQMRKRFTGNIQSHLNLDECKTKILIPIFPDTFQSKIESIVKSAHAKLEESKSLYSQAEDLLLNELGLKDWRPKNTLHTTKKFSDFAQSGRLDAEYYQPKYDDLFERLQKVDCKTIKEIQIINYRGFQPEYVENGKIDVINSKHILEDGLDYENFEKTDEVSFNNAVRAQVKYGDILTYTTGANIGRTQVYLSEKKAMASNHVNMLRVKDVNPIYLALVLNSKIGRMQTEKSSTGSAQVELYPDDLASFIIPILPEQIQTKIASLIQQSFECKAQSKQLLEDAKRMVEAEIEKN